MLKYDPFNVKSVHNNSCITLILKWAMFTKLKCKLKQDSHLDRRSRRQALWPLDHPHARVILFMAIVQKDWWVLFRASNLTLTSNAATSPFKSPWRERRLTIWEFVVILIFLLFSANFSEVCFRGDERSWVVIKLPGDVCLSPQDQALSLFLTADVNTLFDHSLIKESIN